MYFPRKKGRVLAKKEFKFDTSKLKDTNKRSTGRVMELTVIFQHSTQNFLYAWAEKEFVDFLFSFISIPLGVVE